MEEERRRMEEEKRRMEEEQCERNKLCVTLRMA